MKIIMLTQAGPTVPNDKALFLTQQLACQEPDAEILLASLSLFSGEKDLKKYLHRQQPDLIILAPPFSSAQLFLCTKAVGESFPFYTIAADSLLPMDKQKKPGSCALSGNSAACRPF